MEADRRLRAYETAMRMRKRLARDAQVWQRYEEDQHRRASHGTDNSR